VYTIRDFKTKKELKDAVDAGKIVMLQVPIIGSTPTDGLVSLEGPHAPAPHTWYAEAWLKNGKVIRVS
jgi:hypothetical protein